MPQFSHSQVFGTHMKSAYNANETNNVKPTVARIAHVDRFLNWSLSPWMTPWAASSIFSRMGFHYKVYSYVAFGLATFFGSVYYSEHYKYQQENSIEYMFGTKELVLVNRLMTFLLSSYITIMISTYHIAVRKKTRNMNYGASNAVDTIVATIDYDHPNANKFLSNTYGAMTSIGRYALVNASKSCKAKSSHDDIIKLFEERGLNGYHLSQIAPKQVLHILRLAIVQAVKDERDKNNSEDGGCFKRMSDQDWQALRTQLNDYCGGASQTCSCVSSSKLPYPYVEFVNWAVHTISIFQTLAFYTEKADAWTENPTCGMGMNCDDGDDVVTFMHVLHFLLINTFEIFLLYFIFGALEIYHALSEIWASGLVLENYMGIIDLICSPLQPNLASRPSTFADISSTTLDEGGMAFSTKMVKTYKVEQNEDRDFSRRTFIVDDIEEETIPVPSGMGCKAMSCSPIVLDMDDEDGIVGIEMPMVENFPPVKMHIPASRLLQAASNDVCSICLENFKLDDNIIFCSNQIPHCFHQECSLDYLLAHTEGVQAPCPLCRKPILCSLSSNDDNSKEGEKEEYGTREGGASIPSHPSSVSLSGLPVQAAASEMEFSSPV